ncbi:MAG: NADH:flavin oxidoreductase [Burkholderiaceae bacterium]
MAVVSILSTPVRLGALALPNRIAVAPMTRVSATEEGLATEEMVRYYARFARGGFGLIITEGTYPDLQYSQGYLHQPGIANDAQAAAWRPVVDAVHAEGARIVMQLMHAGALSQGNHWQTGTIGPSAVEPRGEQLGFYRGEGRYPVPREVATAEIGEIVESFAAAAVRAKDAGFDGVEIHGANGYLLDQFLTDTTNRRGDDYGGSTQNRVRLLAEVAAAVRARAGDGYPVGIRISQGKVNDYEHKWAGGEEDARIIFETLGRTGLDYLHTTEHHATAPAFGEGSPSLASLAKRHGGLPVIANGGLGDPMTAEAFVAQGHADVIALGKSALANRDWPQRAAASGKLAAFDFSLLQPIAHIKPAEL